MSVFLQALGYAALSGITFLLLAVGLWNTVILGKEPLQAALVVVVLLLFVKGICSQWQNTKQAQITVVFWERKHFTDFLAVAAGSLLTFWLQSHGGIDVVAASALVGLFAVLVHRPSATAMYCGSFAGMASAELFHTLPLILVASLLSAVFFALAKPCFAGFGGKLGTTAFAGTVPTALLFGRAFLPSPEPFAHGLGYLAAITITAALLTYGLQHRLRWHAVTASAIVGLTAALFLPLLPGGAELAAAAFCASFIGMANRQRLPHEGAVAAAAAICALLFTLTAPYFIGTGGKLGTIAFASTVAASALFTAPQLARQRVHRSVRAS